MPSRAQSATVLRRQGDRFTGRVMNRLIGGLQWSRPVRIFIVTGILLLIGLIDFVTPYEVSFKMLYLVPVALAVAWLGLRGGVIAGLCSFAASVGGDLANRAPHPELVVFWNALIGLTAFILLATFLNAFIILYRESEHLVRQRTAALEKSLAERERLQQEILAISERERNAIGHELHDALGQHLTGTALVAQTEAHRLAAKAEFAGGVWKIVRLIEEGIVQVRQLAHGLLLADIQPEELSIKLEELAFATQHQDGITCRFRQTGEPLAPNSTTSSHLFRIAQEAVRNALRHAGAATVDIQLAGTPDALELTIRDTGRGFDPRDTGRAGLGVRIMQHRASLIGGHFKIESSKDAGTLVHCTVPLVRPAP